MLNDLTLIEKRNLFTINRKAIWPYEKKDNVWVSVTIEVDLNLTVIERKIYTLFDLLSEIGGLSQILAIIVTAIVACWNYNSFDNMMVTNLFKAQKSRDKSKDSDLEENKSEFLKVGSMPNCRDILYSLVPDCCVFCKRSRK